MIPLITTIEPLPGLKLRITFDNGQPLIVSFRRMFTPFWLPQFADQSTFNQVTITADRTGITWFDFVTITSREILDTRPDLSIEEDQPENENPQVDDPATPEINESLPWWKRLFGG